MSELWKRETYTSSSMDMATVARIEWLRSHPDTEGMTLCKSFDTKRGLLSLIDTVTSCLTNPHVGSDVYQYTYVFADDAFVVIETNYIETNYDGEGMPASASMEAYNERELYTLLPRQFLL